MTAFTLKPFPGDVFPASLEIVGNISRQGPSLVLHYEIRGNLEAVVLPERTGKPVRRDGLWQETCLEFFFGQKSDPGYWEVNLSPAGHWNVYRFAAYRQGMAEEAAFATLPFGVQRSVGVFRLNLDLDLAGIITRGEALD
ncbi:MAG: DOMON-like domain-containing protein, partial [Desulfobaccales bacterium]